ncbi:MAG TPA: HAD family hydrolase [Candidatus Korarchaeota archaeon]|nr:HAD family hydrolase [Candidatus Korarchaeota archaeon]
MGSSFVRKFRKLNEIEAVLFDMDGVLIDSERAWYQALNSIREELGFSKVSWEFYLKHLGQSIEKDVEIFFKGKGVEEIKEMYIKCFPRFMNQIRLMPDAREVLIKLRSLGLKTGCVTNTPKALAIEILKEFKLLDLLGVVIGGDEVARQKPNPEPILKALSILRVSPDKACFVGDTLHDVEAARRAGCVPIGFKFELKAGIKIRSLTGLIHLLQKQL